MAAEKARIDAEGRKGWLYDGRIAPFVSIRPQVRGTFPMEYYHVDARTGQRRPARPDEIARVDPEADPANHALAGHFAAANSGNRPGTRAHLPKTPPSPPGPACHR